MSSRKKEREVYGRWLEQERRRREDEAYRQQVLEQETCDDQEEVPEGEDN